MKKMLCLCTQFLSVIVSVVCIAMLGTGKIKLAYHGFAVDSQGRLLIGRPVEIDIYEDGAIAGSIPATTNRGCAFTVEEDQVVISAASKVRVLAVDGTIRLPLLDYLIALTIVICIIAVILCNLCFLWPILNKTR